MATPELSVVMPVHNEEAAIALVAGEWVGEVDRLGLDYELVVYDDGSTDATAATLERLGRALPRLVVRSHANRGHGPMILRGYREARGDWIFQTDSDGEMPAASLGDLWAERDGYDVLLGYREGRQTTPIRWIVTQAARSLVQVLFGRRLRDVNTPFRLMRREAIAPLVAALPDDCFAPNVALSGLAARAGLRICERPVPHGTRRGGRSSLGGRRLRRAAMRSFRQTVVIALRARGVRR